ncbi:hypothetical protein [Glycomyces algeriensis]|uniref:hypothetical protein n=1 Tax=Glycomyces algeriensis TaxID=256037 RepID=UPI0022D1D5A4|nr:hypothetical protein [Glycomyces algeriensis]MDA1364430.1 hypothetical protein [Glycomyces algeriensis]MDR7350463.1 hypothetical protein [Glycomyces algeriensis]
MPHLVTVRVVRPGHRTLRLWIPVLLLVILLSPILLLALLGGVIACMVFDMRVLPTFAGVWRVIAALPGSRFDIEQGRHAFLVNIR